MTPSPAAASRLRTHVLTNQWAAFHLAEAVDTRLRASELTVLVLQLHSHAHYDADGNAAYDMRRVVVSCCTSCGPVTQDRWCPTVSAIAARLGIDLDETITRLGHEDATEQLAAQHCAHLRHSHSGSPRCAGYRAAVEEYETTSTTNDRKGMQT